MAILGKNGALIGKINVGDDALQRALREAKAGAKAAASTVSTPAVTAPTPTQTAAPQGFSGSVSVSGAANGAQQSIVDRMNANSRAWHTAASDAERDALHAENLELARQLAAATSQGGSTDAGFDPASGKWSISVTAPQQQTVTSTTPRDYDLSEYIRRQQAARLESELAGLKEAYDKGIAGYDAQLERLPQSYNAARNQAAAQTALAQRAFDERAIASGLSTGAAGQADLARSSALTGALANIGQEQANAESDLALQRANLEAQYQAAMQQARANGDATLAKALYEELIRVQELQREDEQRAAQQQITMAQLAAGYSDYSGLEGLGIDTSAYQQQLAAAAQAEQEKAAAAAGKPTLSAAQVNSAIKNGILTPNVLAAYEYYYGAPYGGGLGTMTAGSSGSGGSSGTRAGGTRGAGAGYDNGSLTAAQVREMQQYYGLSADGLWGPNSQSTTGMNANDAWAAYQRGRTTQGAGTSRAQVLQSSIAAIRSAEQREVFLQRVNAAESAGEITSEQANALRAQVSVSGGDPLAAALAANLPAAGANDVTSSLYGLGVRPSGSAAESTVMSAISGDPANLIYRNGVYTWNGQTYATPAALSAAVNAAYRNGTITRAQVSALVDRANAQGISFDD